MSTSYLLYLLTFLGFPIIGYVISKHIALKRIKPILLGLPIFFITHNILFSNGLSISGDYPDYVIFSLEYLYLCVLILAGLKSNQSYIKIIRGFGIALLGIGFVQGLIGVLMFIIVAQNYEVDKIYNFNHNGVSYQSRQYTFGFALSIDVIYTFETYRKFDKLPFEFKVNETQFIGTECELNFDDDNFTVGINNQFLEFASSNGEIQKVKIE